MTNGKYLFFVRVLNGNADLYWVDAKIIDELKPDELKLNKGHVINLSGLADVVGGAIIIGIAFLTIVGYILFGVAILQSRMFPRAGAVLSIIGAVLLFSFPFVFGIAFTILGNSISYGI